MNSASTEENDANTKSTSYSRVENDANPVNIAPPPDNYHVYRQDVVKHNDKTMIGVVTEVAGDSDSESDITDDEDDSDDDNNEQQDRKTNEAEEEEDDDDDSEDDNDDDSEEGEKAKTGDPDESSDDNKSSGNEHRRDPLTADQVRVLWMDDSETIHNQREVTVVDRGFLHGDYVASALDPTGQVGLIVDVNISVDLLAPDGSVVNCVSTKDLKRVRDFTAGDYVVSGHWLGRVDDVLDNVTVLFDDGSVCKVMRAEPLRLRPIAKNLLEEGQCPYHPGQRVRASSSTVFKRARWVSGTWKANRLEGTVVKVVVGSVYVHWVASGGHGPESSVSPAEEQVPKNLKLLSCFTHANWQLGDWCLLPSLSLSSGFSEMKLQESKSVYSGCETNDEVESVYADDNAQTSSSPTKSSSCASSLSVGKDTVHENWHTHRKKLRKVVLKRDKKVQRKKEDNFERALLIVNTRTSVDVAWQDGTVQRGLTSTLLIPIESPGDHDFVAEQYVVEKAGDDSEGTPEEDVKRVGVVKSVNAKEKTARVRWLKRVDKPEDPREFEKEEIVSVYELEGHPDYDYCYGDVVVRLSPVCEEGNEVGEEGRKENLDLSWVGNITGLRDGDIEVTWADGMVSTVGPQAVYVVGRDDDESIVGGSEVSDAASWETIEDNEIDALSNTETKQTSELEETNNTEQVEEEIPIGGEANTGVSGPLSIPLAAVGYVARLASGIFSRGGRGHDTWFENDKEILISESQTDQSESMADEAAAAVVEGFSEKVNRVSCYGEDTLCFKRFDTATDPLDHFFLASNNPGSSGRKWLKKVQRDWNILQNNLPDGIFVRVYEDRMDLLRAVIVGAYGTPYQDGLFFFDFHLPSDYPDVPPSAHYHSGGWRINPNLYEEGKVCLSLLNTWTGRGNEVWDPQSSSILQVLVSLQGLVLNSKPYFNEAGYDKQVGTAEGEKNSLSYNENTFLLNCKTMMHLIRRPPKDFEDLVKEHFKRRGNHILKACDTYMKGYLIGSLSKDACVTDKSEADATSVGFKLMLAKIAPKLFSSLSEVGADCNEFGHMRQS